MKRKSIYSLTFAKIIACHLTEHPLLQKHLLFSTFFFFFFELHSLKRRL